MGWSTHKNCGEWDGVNDEVSLFVVRVEAGQEEEYNGDDSQKLSRRRVL